MVVIDEAYHLFGSKSSLPLIKKFGNLIVLKNFSKAYGVASARIGVTISNQSNMNFLSNARPAHELPSVSIAVAEYLLDNFNLVMNSAKKVVQGRNYVKKILKKYNVNCIGSYGNYLLIILNNSNFKNKLLKNLMKNKIYIKNFNDEILKNSILITIGPSVIMKKFLNVFIKTYKNFFKK
jgi:histidinol-phosphate aminotransferase